MPASLRASVVAWKQERRRAHENLRCLFSTLYPTRPQVENPDSARKPLIQSSLVRLAETDTT